MRGSDRRPQRMRLLSAGASAVVTVVAFMAAAPALAATATNFRAAGVVTQLEAAGNGDYYVADASGTATFSFGGSGTFAATVAHGCTPFYAGPPYICQNLFQMTLWARNGDRLDLAGANAAPVGTPLPNPTWHVVAANSTGRFAGFTGSGTYAFTGPDSFTLSGTLLPRTAVPSG